MPQDILVVEYEPRYTERVKQALSGQPLTPLFAKDGEEALRAIEGSTPSLIVLSSVIPRISTTELIRMIRTRPPLTQTPILITVSGYNGKAPKADAGKIGASDILPKPYSEAEFLGKVQSMLGLKAEQPGAPAWAKDVESEFIVHPAKPAIPEGMKTADAGALTSNEIFGDIFEDDKPAARASSPAASSPSASSKMQTDLDKILADTLSGVRVPSKKRVEPAKPDAAKPAAPPDAKSAETRAAEAKAKNSADLDRLLEDTLSGLEKTAKKPAPAAAVQVAPAPAPAAKPAAAPPAPAPPAPAPPAPAPPAPAPVPVAETVAIASPVIPPVQPTEKEKEEADDARGIRFGQYLLQDRIATGGMAEVWKARMRGVEGFQKIVAIKKILPHLSDNEEFVTMFIDEAKLAAQLNHNNIIHIYDLGKIANSYYIAMEYIDGHDLKTILKRGEERGQPMPADLAIFVASKIASALDYAHRKRDLDEHEMELVHRDVSPQNVLISHEGDIKLCDFGIAKAASKASHTQAGALKGKLQYMSPEQAWGKKIDRRSDIFALSAVLFEMLTGRKLFTGDSEISILEQVREAKVTAPSEINDEVTPEIDAIVLKALRKEPEDRYQTAGEMARDLDAVLYSFRPTPTSADLAIHMHRLYSAEPLPVVQHSVMMEPAEEDENIVSIKPSAVAPVAASAAAAAPAVSAAGSMFAAQPEQTEKKLPIVPIAIGAVAVVAIAIGGFFAMRGKTSAPPRPAAVTSAAPVTTSSVAPLATDTTATLATATTATAPDQASVDEEVKKRLEAERLKLDQQRAQQLAQTTATQAPAPQAAPATASAAPAQQPAAQAAPPPAPVSTPVPQPVAEPRPEPAAPAPAQTQAARVREGDLVPAGTDGLRPPELVSQYRPGYPPIARAQKVQGVVIVSALVSETGRVLQTTILRGIPQLNDAALEAVRRSTFRPATKDGVRVKSYKTITVPFKL